jgi:hypothetical protein
MDNRVTCAYSCAFKLLFKRNVILLKFIQVKRLGRSSVLQNQAALKRLDYLSIWLISMNWIQMNVDSNSMIGISGMIWHHHNSSQSMLQLGQVDQLFIDEGYATTFDMAETMANFNVVNLVMKWAAEECMTAFNNMIFMTYKQRFKSAAAAFLLINGMTNNRSYRRFIFDLATCSWLQKSKVCK